MIALLTGTVCEKHQRAIIIDVQGVGYLVFVTRDFLEKVELGLQKSLHIHTHVREDAITLYGFPSREEWQFFELLLTVSGVGPKSALEIMNAPTASVKQAIAKKDAVFLTRIPGIGRKTAERIIVDLQGKVKEQLMGSDDVSESTFTGHDEIIEALISLGYTRQHVVQGLKKIPSELAGEEAIIKYFLQNL